MDVTCDLAVMGSGAAGLAAALAAHDAGLSVQVLEASGSVGGTTAVSGGVIWVPCNRHQLALGLDDSVEAARQYLERISEGRSEAALRERYLAQAPQVVEYIEQVTGTEFECLATYPDYQPELPGGRSGGRSLDNQLYDTGRLGPWQQHLRKNPLTGKAPMTIGEAMKWRVFSEPMAFPFREVYGRYKAGLVHGGAALIGRLLEACLSRGIEPKLNTRGVRLLGDSTRVTGVVAQRGVDGADGELRVHATRGVVLASGGFEWNAQLCKDFLLGVPTHPASVPSSRGDGLVMAMALGAELGNMSQAWWCPMADAGGETYDGAPLYRPEFAARCLPHSIIVGPHGMRFTAEATNYNDVTKPFFDHSPASYDSKNLPAWLIVDRAYREKYSLLHLPPEAPDAAAPPRPLPDWVVSADSLEELAERCGIDSSGLVHTVAEFNAMAQRGRDTAFGRGDSAFDRFYGDPRHLPNANLGELSRAPYYAVRLFLGTIGTKGGPKVDEHGRVRLAGGGVLPGLYAAGNVMAGITGPGYPGAGVTIGVALTWGYLAGRHAAQAASAASAEP